MRCVALHRADGGRRPTRTRQHCAEKTKSDGSSLLSASALPLAARSCGVAHNAGACAPGAFTVSLTTITAEPDGPPASRAAPLPLSSAHSPYHHCLLINLNSSRSLTFGQRLLGVQNDPRVNRGTVLKPPPPDPGEMAVSEEQQPRSRREAAAGTRTEPLRPAQGHAESKLESGETGR